MGAPNLTLQGGPKVLRYATGDTIPSNSSTLACRIRGFASLTPYSQPPVSVKCSRHQWSDERWTWKTEWNDIVLTDGSRLCLQHHNGRTQVWRHRGERLLNSCVMHHHIGPDPGIMVWGGIGFHCRTPLLRRLVLNSQRYISEVLEPVPPYILRLPSAILKQDNA
ncbi:transposable element Tcb1 transposase [Trichonephila clavipes]|nr:transposable element Tcb1 transposase [Trichonephila clavipes]